MYNLDLEKFKFILSLKYKKYLKNNDKKVFLDLMKDFLIPIDVDRINDFVITSYDPLRVAIGVIDKKTNTIYYSSYKNDKNNFLFGCNLEVEKVTNEEKLVKVYDGRSRKLVGEELSVIYDGHELKINKNIGNKTNSFTYSSILDSFDHKSFPMITKAFSSDLVDGSIIDTQQLYVPSNGNNPYRRCEFIDEDLSFLQNNVIYRIAGSSVFGNTVKGVCFLDGNINSFVRNKFLPIEFCCDSFEKDNKSVMIFNADDNKDSVNLRIVKTKNSINVYYEKFFLNKKDCVNEYLSFPILSYGSITNSEIRFLSKMLREKCNDSLVESICNRLENFGDIIEHYNGNEKKEIDLIDKDFYNYSIEEIGKIISNNKGSYFQYMSDLYHELIDDIRLPREEKILSKKVN